MLFDHEGKPVLFDEIELLVDQLAKEKLHELTINQDNSRFWLNFTNIFSSAPVAGFHEAYDAFREAMLNNGKQGAELFDYTSCLTIQMRAKPFSAKALETTLSQLTSLRTDEQYADVLDQDYFNLDPMGELLLFIRVNIRPIERRVIEVHGKPISLPTYHQVPENDHDLHGTRRVI